MCLVGFRPEGTSRLVLVCGTAELRLAWMQLLAILGLGLHLRHGGQRVVHQVNANDVVSLAVHVNWCSSHSRVMPSLGELCAKTTSVAYRLHRTIKDLVDV